MGKVVPFKRKPGSPEEEALSQCLQANPNDLETLTALFLLKVREEKFDPKSDYANGILRCIETVGLEAINQFLYGVAPIVEAMDWSEPSPEFTAAITALAEKANAMVKKIPEEIREEILFPTRFKNEIYKSFFEEDKFLDYVCRIVPINVNHETSSGKSDKRDLFLRSFLVDCFKKIIAKYGLVELLVYIIVFSSCPILLMDKARKVKSTTDLLWPFFSFVEDNSVGGRKIFDFKNALFDIKNKYRNPAAHPSNYSRDLLDGFKDLLFQEGFIKDYFESIQIKVTK